MAYKQVSSLDSDLTISLGGVNKKTNKPNPTKLEGYYLGSRDVESKMAQSGFCKLHFFQTASGNVGVWGKTDLDRKIGQVTLGAMTRVTHTGMQKIPGKQPMYKFQVEIDDENTIEVAQQENTLQTQDESPNGEFDAPDASFDTGLDEDLSDEVPQMQARRPAVPAQTPDAARQAKVKELLAKNKSKTA